MVGNSEGDVGKRPGGTIYDVAREAGVSAATVSRTINGNYPVSKVTREKVERAMASVGYVANAHAKALAGTGTRPLGILIEEIGDPYFGAIARGVQQEAVALGRLPLVCNTQGRTELEDSFLDLLLENRADLVVVIGGQWSDAAYTRTNIDRAHKLARVGCRLALCGRAPLPGEPGTVGVAYENEQGAFTLADHLLTQGHRRILYLGGPPELATTLDRRAGFERAHRTHGVEPDPQLVDLGPMTLRWGYQQMSRRLESLPRPDGDAAVSALPDFSAVFCGNDLVAAGAYQAVKEAGLSIPRDLSITGYDDVPMARVLDPALTTIRVPAETIGREAVRAGLDQELSPAAADVGPWPEPVRLGTSLVVRGSTAAPRR